MYGFAPALKAVSLVLTVVAELRGALRAATRRFNVSRIALTKRRLPILFLAVLTIF